MNNRKLGKKQEIIYDFAKRNRGWQSFVYAIHKEVESLENRGFLEVNIISKKACFFRFKE